MGRKSHRYSFMMPESLRGPSGTVRAGTRPLGLIAMRGECWLNSSSVTLCEGNWQGLTKKGRFFEIRVDFYVLVVNRLLFETDPSSLCEWAELELLL